MEFFNAFQFFSKTEQLIPAAKIFKLEKRKPGEQSGLRAPGLAWREGQAHLLYKGLQDVRVHFIGRPQACRVPQGFRHGGVWHMNVRLLHVSRNPSERSLPFGKPAREEKTYW